MSKNFGEKQRSNLCSIIFWVPFNQTEIYKEPQTSSLMEGIIFQRFSLKCLIVTLNRNYQNFTLNVAGQVLQVAFIICSFNRALSYCPITVNAQFLILPEILKQMVTLMCLSTCHCSQLCTSTEERLFLAWLFDHLFYFSWLMFHTLLFILSSKIL